MAIYTCATWAALKTAVETSASDGDTIVISANLTQTSALTITKSLTFSWTETRYITGNADAIKIEAQAGGSTILFQGTGNLVFNKNTLTGIPFQVSCTNGDLNLKMWNCIFTASLDNHGFQLISPAASAFNAIVHLYNCTGMTNAVDAFNATPSATATGDYELYLHNCTGTLNGDDGVAAHNTAVIFVYGGSFTSNTKAALITADSAQIHAYNATLAQDTQSVAEANGTSCIVNVTNCNISGNCDIVGDALLHTVGGGHVTAKSCGLAGSGGQVYASGTGSLTCYDCTFTSVGTYTTTAPMRSFTGCTLNLYRCYIDYSGATCDSGFSCIWTQAALNVSGCVILQADISGSVSSAVEYCVTYAAGSTGTFIHNTCIEGGSDQNYRGAYIQVDNIIVRGNLMIGFQWAFRYGNATHYSGVADSGYNVMLDWRSAAFFTASAKSTDITSGTTPTFDTDYSLLVRGSAESVDPYYAYQRQTEDTHEITYYRNACENNLDAGAYTPRWQERGRVVKNVNWTRGAMVIELVPKLANRSVRLKNLRIMHGTATAETFTFYDGGTNQFIIHTNNVNTILNNLDYKFTDAINVQLSAALGLHTIVAEYDRERI